VNGSLRTLICAKECVGTYAAVRRERLAAARAGFDMRVPFNELNRVFALGFKPLPWEDKGYVSTTMQGAELREENTGGS
jgi:hypothetical protein